MKSIGRSHDDLESLRFLMSLASDRLPTGFPIDAGFAALAEEHRMQGLVVSALAGYEDEVSSSVRRQLTSFDGETWARHMFLASELGRVSSALAESGVEHYLIKGLAVEERFYDRTGERPYADLDIVLLSSSSLSTALRTLGESNQEPLVLQRLVDEGWIQSVDVLLPSAAQVDLHVDPLKLGFPARFAGSARQHLVPMTVNGTTVFALDPTASLIVALLHLNRNRFRYLSGFADVVRILKRGRIDWDAFAEMVYDDGLEVLIDRSLRTVCEDLDLDPDLIDGWTSKKIGGSTAKRAIWNMAWRPSTRLSGLSGRFRMGRRSQFLLPALCRGRSTWVVRWMMRRLFPPSSVLELNHPEATGPYLVRLVSGRWNQIRHNRFHRAGTRQRGRQVDDDVAESAE